MCETEVLFVFTKCFIAVVLLRGCWLDGTNKCLKNGAAEVENIFCFPLLLKNGLLWWQHHFFPQVCTCSTDLCNSARLVHHSHLHLHAQPHYLINFRPGTTSLAHLLFLLLLGLAVHFVPLHVFQLEPQTYQQHVGEQHMAGQPGRQELAQEEAESIRTRSPIPAGL